MSDYNPFAASDKEKLTHSIPSKKDEVPDMHNPFKGKYSYKIKRSKTTRVKYVRKQD